ncbi:MAG: D-alanyl-D-alanine carboxypeptidase family protein [Phormidesmis sp.]
MNPQILENRFEIEEQISRTDFMAVYLARDRHYLHRPHCIVKSIHYRQANMRHRIEREVHTLELLGAHPQIPNVLAYFHTGPKTGQPKTDQSKRDSAGNTDEQTFYIVQSWLDGHPLSQEISADRPLSEGYVSKLLKDVLVPLVRVHEQGVVHQSLHPQHLIRRNTDGQIFLTEFGTLPKLARSTVSESGALTTSVPVSPQPYSAPELLQQNPQPASDLYSLGLIAIEALTGRRHQDLSFDPARGLLWREYVTLGDGADGKATRSLAEFIDRLVRHDWRDRFENAQVALSQLRTVQNRNQIAQDSRYPTIIAAPGKQATAFGKTAGPEATAIGTQPGPAKNKLRNNLPYPLNLAVGGPKPTRGTAGNLSHSPYGTYTARSPQTNPYLFKWAVGSIAILLALGIGFKTYRWGEYRISRLPQSWSDWAINSAESAYPVADAEQLVPLFSGDSSLLLQPAAVMAYWQMSAAAEADGIKLYPLSGYRSEPEAMPPTSPIDTQDAQNQAEAQALEDAQTEAQKSARHAADYHTGYALDIGGASESTDRQPSFAKTDAYKWLADNAETYGFKLSSTTPSPLKRGLLGVASDQPWHWRYVGDEASQEIFSSGSR